MSARPLMEWLASTEWSIALIESQYVYAIVESVHVWALCLFLGFAVLLDLRLVGVLFRRVPVSHLTRQLLPWTKAGFAVMVVSGLVLFFAIPLRTYHNIFFRAKVVLLVLAGLNAFVFHRGIHRRVAEWDVSLPLPRAAWVAGAVSLVLWAGIVVSGRMIAYNWFDCGKPQGALVATLAGCSPDDIDPYR